MVTENRRGRIGPVQLRRVYYGQLHSILDVILPASQTLGLTQPTRHLLALVEPCSTGGKDATRGLAIYEAMTAPIIIDLRTVECVVGRVKRGNEWGIIDRSGDFARTVFVDPIDDEEQ